MAADLFETYAVTLSAAMLLGALTLGGNAVIFPLILGGAAIVASIAGGLFVRLPKSGSIMGALYKGLIAALIFSAAIFYWAAKQYFGADYLPVYLASLIGLAVTR